MTVPLNPNLPNLLNEFFLYIFKSVTLLLGLNIPKIFVR